MNREDIIRIAREAGFNVEQGYLLRITGIDEDLERFAALVASAEHDRIFGDLLKMHEMAKSQHNYFLHAVLTLKARGDSMTSRTHTPEDVQKIMKPWVGLTEAQCGVLWKTNMTPFEYYQAIEAKLKEKNT